jgi:hypothetical protein
MEVTGMLCGAKLLQFAGYPTAEVLGPDASEGDIKSLVEKHGSVFVKPVFKGGVGKKGKAGLIGRASDLKTALNEKERLYFVEHRVGNMVAKANGVTFEGAVPADVTLRAIADALRQHVSRNGPTPLYVVVGRGGPNLVRGMGALRDTCEALGLPYRIFGFESDMSEVIAYARAADAWMKSGGREQLAKHLGITAARAA